MKRVFLIIVVIAIIMGIGLVLLKVIEQQRILRMVKSGQVEINQVMSDWNVCKDDAPVKMHLYVRNTGVHTITGDLVFLVTLSKKGLEETFIKQIINCYGEDRVRREMAEGIAQKGSLGRLAGIYNYLLRGKKLLPGQDYEPSTEIMGDDYSFRFRKQILLNPGELIKIYHEEQIPFNERGNLLSIKIENIEF